MQCHCHVGQDYDLRSISPTVIGAVHKLASLVLLLYIFLMSEILYKASDIRCQLQQIKLRLHCSQFTHLPSDDAKWTKEELTTSLQPDHGYTASSTAVTLLVEVPPSSGPSL